MQYKASVSAIFHLLLLAPTQASLHLASTCVPQIFSISIHALGFGMILLQILSRFQILFTLVAAQVLGSLTMIVARASAPDKVGPGSVFPNFCINPHEGLASA